jgi:hypothetical protein
VGAAAGAAAAGAAAAGAVVAAGVVVAAGLEHAAITHASPPNHTAVRDLPLITLDRICFDSPVVYMYVRTYIE